MFETVFNVVYRRIPNFYFAYLITFFVHTILRLNFYIQVIFHLNSKPINLTLSESRKIINDLHPTCINKEILPQREINSNVELSIIVPAYNVEKYITECLESLLTQTTTYPYEVIVINDGSTDNTLNILQSYNNDKKLQIINQTNMGISFARNKGLEVAKGKYYMFVDSDDKIDNGMVEKMLSTAYAENADIVECSFYYLEEATHALSLGRPLKRTKFSLDLGSNMDDLFKIKGFPWMKIYKRELWNNIDFPTEIQIFEDTIIKMVILNGAKKYVYIPDCFYYYRMHQQSITKTSVGKPLSLCAFHIVPSLYTRYKSLGINQNDVFYLIMLYQLGAPLFGNTRNLPENVVDACIVLSKELLESHAKTTKKLNFSSQMLERSILTLNKPLWMLCAKNKVDIGFK